MLAYTVIFGLFSIFFVQNDYSQYPLAYTAVCALMYAVIFAGNLLYSLGYATRPIQSLWKFVFPLVMLHFVGTGIVDARFGRHAHSATLVSSIIVWAIGLVLFFPAFRAHFLLGYSRDQRV